MRLVRLMDGDPDELIIPVLRASGFMLYSRDWPIYMRRGRQSLIFEQPECAEDLAIMQRRAPRSRVEVHVGVEA